MKDCLKINDNFIAEEGAIAEALEKTKTDQILAERGKTYGNFSEHAEIAQRLKLAMHEHSGWEQLEAHHAESLDMIQHKIARIINGDPNYIDSWVDIAGYAQLVVDIIEGETNDKEE